VAAAKKAAPKKRRKKAAAPAAPKKRRTFILGPSGTYLPGEGVAYHGISNI